MYLFAVTVQEMSRVSLEQWGVMTLISISLRGNLTDQKTALRENE